MCWKGWGSAEIPRKTQLNSDAKLGEELGGGSPTEGLFLHLFPILSTIKSSCKEGFPYRNQTTHQPNQPGASRPLVHVCPIRLSLALGCQCIQHYFQKPNPHAPTPAQLHTGLFVHSNAAATSWLWPQGSISGSVEKQMNRGPYPSPIPCVCPAWGWHLSQRQWENAVGAARENVPCNFPCELKVIYVLGGILPVWLEKCFYVDFHGRSFRFKARFQMWWESFLSPGWIFLPWAVLCSAVIPAPPSSSHISAYRRLPLH